MFKSGKLLKRNALKQNFKNLSKGFCEYYTPNKKLVIINHPNLGKVYPVYIADEKYNKVNDPRKLSPLIVVISGVNFFCLLSSFNLLPYTHFFHYIIQNFVLSFSLFWGNAYLLTKYFNYLNKYKNKAKEMYLMPSGDQVLVKYFNGDEKKIDNVLIFECNVTNNYADKEKDSIFVNNENSFSAQFSWGPNKDVFFDGKVKYLDFEIFSQIISRKNIEMKMVKYDINKITPSVWTTEQKKKVLERYTQRKRMHIQNIDRHRLFHHYIKLKRKYSSKKKEPEPNKHLNVFV